LTASRRFVTGDVAQALLDKRIGQRCDDRVGPRQKAEIIQQWAARAVTGQRTSSAVLAEQVNAPAWWCQRLSRRTARAANLAAVAPSSDRRIGRCAGCAQHHRSRARLLAQYRAPLDCASQGNRGARGSCPVGAPGHLPAGGAAAHRGVLLPNPATARRRKMDTAMGRAPSAGGHEHRRWVLVKSFDHCVKI